MLDKPIKLKVNVMASLKHVQGHPTTVFYRMLLDAVLGYLEYF